MVSVLTWSCTLNYTENQASVTLNDCRFELKDILDLNQTEQTPDTFSSAMFNFI